MTSKGKRWACDTSVAVAALDPAHEAHPACRRALIDLRPALAGHAAFETYSVLTRLTTRDEPTFPAFFWPGVIGAVIMTAIGLPHWQAIGGIDLAFLMIYASISVFSHWLLLKCYQVAEASSVQPFAYLQIVFVSIIGITVYGETLALSVVLGTALIVAAGIYALWHSNQAAKVAVE